MKKLLESQAVGLSKTKEHRETFEETCCVRICIYMKKQKNRKSNDEEGGDKQKKARFIIDNEKQDPFRFVSV